ncbi:hypothetical protein [Salinibacillus xinjiangensis]|nr:hypothetical protein [Salinibacillus xinjiangensis]
MTSRENECSLKIRKEVYGDKPIEEAYREALEPYFNPGQYWKTK